MPRLRMVSCKALFADLRAGMVLGIESVPDGLANGVLAGVNPLAGLYGYLFGMVGAAAFTSSSFMAVQSTGAMSLIVSDAGLGSRPGPERALYTLSVLTGLIMIAAGLLGGGKLIRFVPTAVMTGFVTAIGVNIVLGQLSNFTGYAARGPNRIMKTADTLLHATHWGAPTLVVGAITLLTILVLHRTRLGSFSLVVAVVVGSACAALLNLWVGARITVLHDIVQVPRSLPLPVMPSVAEIGHLIVPAVSLAFVGLVQGAGVSAGIPSRHGTPPDVSRDFIGQGIGNIVSGVFRGQPVGGSMSASALVVAARARSRFALVIAAAVMAVVVLTASQAVSRVAMPALAALLIYVGATAVKPSRVNSVIRSDVVQASVMAVTFVLTLLIPLQFAVLVGAGAGIILFVARHSNRVRLRRVIITGDGRMREEEPPTRLGDHEVLVLQPYGSLFFASAPVVEQQLPDVSRTSRHSVVVLRLRGTDEIGLSFQEVLRRYLGRLRDADSSMKVVVSEDRVMSQLEAGGFVSRLGPGNVYRGSEWVGETVRRAYRDAVAEVGRH